MEPSCVQFLENKTVLVTGASGFLAKGNNLYTLIYHDISVEYISSMNLFNRNYYHLFVIKYSMFINICNSFRGASSEIATKGEEALPPRKSIRQQGREATVTQ